jgi:hypothetical protein
MPLLQSCTNQFCLSRMKKDDDSSKQEEDRRLQIARAIAMKTFDIKKPKKVEHSIPTDRSHQRGVGTSEIIRNSKYQQLYTMEIERAYMTCYHFQNVITEMVKMSRYSTVNTKSLIRTLREGLKVHPEEILCCSLSLSVSLSFSLSLSLSVSSLSLSHSPPGFSLWL